MATTFHYITFLDGGLNQEVTLRFNQNGPLVKHKNKIQCKTEKPRYNNSLWNINYNGFLDGALIQEVTQKASNTKDKNPVIIIHCKISIH